MPHGDSLMRHAAVLNRPDNGWMWPSIGLIALLPVLAPLALAATDHDSPPPDAESTPIESPEQRPEDAPPALVGAPADAHVEIGSAQVALAADRVRGAVVKRPHDPDVLFTFSGPGGMPDPDTVRTRWALASGPQGPIHAEPLLTSGFTVQWQAVDASTDVMLCDLNPSQQWYVHVGGAAARALHVGLNGIGQMTVPGAGPQLLRVTIGAPAPVPEPMSDRELPSPDQRVAAVGLPLMPSTAIDTVPPTVTNLRVMASAAATTLTWSTDEPALCVLDFGPTADYGSVIADGNVTSNYQATLTSLQAGTMYHFRITAIDAAGNTTVGVDQVFTANPSPSRK